MTDKQIITATFAGSALILLITLGFLRLRSTPQPDPPPPDSVAASAPVPPPAAPATTPAAQPAARPPDLDTALAALRAKITGSGLRESVVDAYEVKLGLPFPAPVRRLLTTVSPYAWEKFGRGVRLEEIWDCKYLSTPFGDHADKQPDLARGGPFFIFAAGDYGDGIVLDAAGRVLLAETGNGTSVLADSLAAWIDRLVANNGKEYAYLRGEIDHLPRDRRRAFLLDHRRLNPDSEWAAQQLMSLDSQSPRR